MRMIDIKAVIPGGDWDKLIGVDHMAAAVPGQTAQLHYRFEAYLDAWAGVLRDVEWEKS